MRYTKHNLKALMGAAAIVWSGPTLAGSCSPLLIDMMGNGFQLSQPGSGVHFDMTGDGSTEHIQWVHQESDDAFLFLDLNQNGVVDDGRELFGVGTDLIDGSGKSFNGYYALQQYDQAANGGNGDGLISPEDSVWSSLKLWDDDNSDGQSSRGEIRPLSSTIISSIELDHRESRRKDEAGNWLRYWSWATLDRERGRRKVKVVDVYFNEL